jgi:hypothetical protein
MWLGEWQRFKKVGWRWLVSWIGQTHFIRLMIQITLEGKELGCNFGSSGYLGDFFFTCIKKT